MITGIEFSEDPANFSVTYHSPRRPIGNLRDEFNIDARLISETAGPVYIALSSGVDSQIIVRCFIDQKLDAEFVFLYLPGYNELEYHQLLECEKYFGISVRKVILDLSVVKDDWIKDNTNNSFNSISQYPFLYLSSHLDGDFPIVSQGKIEPAIVGISSNKMAIYHNYYESMEIRFLLMSRHRRVYDFPFSPEAISSYYLDDNMKIFASNIRYFTGGTTEYTQYFNSFAKPFVKGKHFKDVIWFPKLTGAEQYPEWLLGLGYSKDTRVSVPYWDLVEFLENNINESKTYNQWIFKS